MPTPLPTLNTLTSINVDIPAAGTRVQASAISTPIRGCVLKALTANTGLVYVGGATVAAANGYPLSPGESISLDIQNLNQIWLDTATNGNDVRVLYSERT